MLLVSSWFRGLKEETQSALILGGIALVVLVVPVLAGLISVWATWPQQPEASASPARRPPMPAAKTHHATLVGAKPLAADLPPDDVKDAVNYPSSAAKGVLVHVNSGVHAAANP
jgi:hypothetical protein